MVKNGNQYFQFFAENDKYNRIRIAKKNYLNYNYGDFEGNTFRADAYCKAHFYKIDFKTAGQR